MRLRSPDGQFIRLVNPQQSSIDWFLSNGYVEADEYEQTKSLRLAICEKHPWESQAAAVNPAQAKEFNEGLRSQGIRGAHYDTRTGNLICTSRSARAKAIRARGMHDRDGGYGD